MTSKSAATSSAAREADDDQTGKQKRHRRHRHLQHNDGLNRRHKNSSDLALRTFVNLDPSANSSRSDIVSPMAGSSAPLSDPSKGSEVDAKFSRADQTRPYIRPRSSSKPSHSNINDITPSQTILHLMKKSQGRIRGQVYLRKSSLEEWQNTHCAIRAVGSLSSEEKDTGALINDELNDLRGIRVFRFLDKTSGFAALQIRSADGLKTIQLRPKKQSLIDSWFAALLCWQAMLPNQKPLQKPPRPFPLRRTIIDPEPYLSRIDASRSKRGRAMLLQTTCRPSDIFPYGNSSIPSLQTERTNLLTTRSPMLCTVGENGHLRITKEDKTTRSQTIHIQLSRFPRSAIQLIDKRVFDQDLIIGLYPQYAFSTDASSQLRPVFLAFDSVELLEMWYILFKTLAQPELHGFDSVYPHDDVDFYELLPGIDSKSSTLFRIESSIYIHITRARLYNEVEGNEADEARKESQRASASLEIPPVRPLSEYDAEILVDEQVKLRTKQSEQCVWYENLNLHGLSPYYSTVSIRVNKTQSNNYSHALANRHPKSVDDFHERPKYEGSTPVGGVVLDRSDLAELSVGVEQSLSLIGQGGSKVGEIFAKFEYKQDEILCERAYDGLCSQLETFSNKLTLKIWRHIPLQLTRLAEVLLDIFQESGHAEQWLKSLADDEILNGASQSAIVNSNNAAVQEETVANRNSGRSAIGEASILFRSNTLFTKALDFYMKRHGRGYLEETLGRKLQQIVDEDLDCEVDPSRLKGPDEAKLYQNWERLIEQAKDIWKTIYDSAPSCPQELKRIFRHISKTAYARYGSVMPSVSYSSVSGFLFLRFFCAAVMTPQLFGLVKETPDPRANRTFLLIAKSLQGLANMATFGSKEPWMSPMNTFCTANREKFKQFLDQICEPSEPLVLDKKQSGDKHAPSRPNRAGLEDEFLLDVYYMLDQRAREGLPSLPHLIDRPLNLAKLVNIWLENVDKETPSTSTEEEDQKEESATSVVTLRTLNSIVSEDNDLARFHASCQAIRHNSESVSGAKSQDGTRYSFDSDHEADYMAPSVMQTWVKIAEHMETDPDYYWTKDVPPIPPATLPALQRDLGIEPAKPEKRRPVSSIARSEKSGRGHVGAGPSSDKVQRPRTSSDSRSSEKRKQAAKKKEPSPSRGPEENALRKLGWL